MRIAIRLGMALALGFWVVNLEAANRWPFANARDVEIEVNFEGSPLPESTPDYPVFPVGTNIAMTVSLHNIGMTIYNNVQAKASLLWAYDTTCTLPGPNPRSLRFGGNQPLPNGISSLQEFTLPGNQSVVRRGNFTIPYDVCPGEVYMLVEARLKPVGSNDPFARHIVPLRIRLVPDKSR